MIPSSKRSLDKWFWLLTGMAGLLLFYRLGAAPVYILDEAKNAQCAREMWLRNDWIVPTFNGSLRTDKPALHYWFMMGSYQLFGFGEWQARFFSAFFGVATVGVTYLAARRWMGQVEAFFAGLVLVLSVHFAFEFRLAVPDPYLIFFTTCGLLAGYGYLTEKKSFWLMTAAGALALATLAKGPVALGLPGICLLCLLVLQKKWWVLGDWRLLVAGLFYLAIAGPWYYLVHLETDGAFTRRFFLDHNLNRFSSEMEGHGGPFFITPLIVLVGLLPFTVLIGRWAGWFRKLPAKPGLLVFGLVVTLAYVVFFSISSTKLPNYPMPCYPMAAVALGAGLASWWRGQFSWPAYGWWILIVIGLALPVAGWLALGAEAETQPVRAYALGLLVLPLGLAIILWKGNADRPKILSWVMMTYLLFNLYVVGIAYPVVYQQNPVTKILPEINKPRVKLVAYKLYNPAFNFQLTQDSISVFHTPMQLAEAATQWQAQGQQVRVLTRQEYLPELAGFPFEEVTASRDIFELPTTSLLKFSGK